MVLADNDWRRSTCLCFCLLACIGAGAVQAQVALSYAVIAKHPHDPLAYTQGLVFDGDTLFESTGLWGESTLRRVDYQSGEVTQSIALHPVFFGEGLALVDNHLVQLTWRSQRGFVYDKSSFELLDTFHYATQGWGLTFDGESLIMSDGTNQLYFLEPRSFVKTRRLAVRQRDVPLHHLNELEYVDGHVYANVYQTSEIAKIDLVTGQVVGVVDLEALAEEQRSRGPDVDVLNGIAFHAGRGHFFVTGKRWDTLYELRINSPD